MCGSCAEGYGQMSGFKCQKCLSRVESILTMSFISFWAFLVFCLLVQNALVSGQVIRIVTVPASALHLTSSGEESLAVSNGTCEQREERKFTLSVNPMIEGVKVCTMTTKRPCRWFIEPWHWVCLYKLER